MRRLAAALLALAVFLPLPAAAQWMAGGGSSGGSVSISGTANQIVVTPNPITGTGTLSLPSTIIGTAGSPFTLESSSGQALDLIGANGLNVTVMGSSFGITSTGIQVTDSGGIEVIESSGVGTQFTDTGGTGFALTATHGGSFDVTLTGGGNYVLAGLPSSDPSVTNALFKASGGFLCQSGSTCSPGSGTVTSIATTSPITGGTITTTGTIACSTCTTSAASLPSGDVLIGGGSQSIVTSSSLTWSSPNLTSGTFIPSSSSIPTNGLYLPASNEPAIAYNSTQAVLFGNSNSITVNGIVTVSVTTDQVQATGGSTLLGVPSGTSIAAGQVVQGTNIPLGDQVSSITSYTGSVTFTTTSASNSGQKVINSTNISSTTLQAGMQCVDTTSGHSAYIGAGNVLTAVTNGTSATLTSNIVTTIPNGDSIYCEPVVTLTATTTTAVASGTAVSFIQNETAVSALSAFYDTGDASINGNLNLGGSMPSLTVTGTVTGGTFVPTSSSVPTNGLYLSSSNVVSIAANSTRVAAFYHTGSSLNGIAINVAASAINTGDMLAIEATGASGGATIETNGSSLITDFYLGTNNSSEQFSILANGSAASSGNGDNSVTLNGKNGLWFQYNGTNGLLVTSGGGVSMPNLAAAGQTDIVCFNTTGGVLSYDTTVALCTGSSARFKDDIRDIDPDTAYAKLYGRHPLRPVRFRYKPEFAKQYGDGEYIGYLAEDVCALDEDLCVREGGKPRTYDQRGLAAYQQAAERASLWTKIKVEAGL